MTASISTLPIWKKDSTPTEWLSELAAMALENPERFSKVIVIYEEETIRGEVEGSIVRWACHNIDTNTGILGLMVSAQLELFDEMKGRR